MLFVGLIKSKLPIYFLRFKKHVNLRSCPKTQLPKHFLHSGCEHNQNILQITQDFEHISCPPPQHVICLLHSIRDRAKKEKSPRSVGALGAKFFVFNDFEQKILEKKFHC